MKALSEIANFAVENWNPVLTIAAFVLSFCDLLLHIRTFSREAEKIKVRQIAENGIKSFCVPVLRDGVEVMCTIVAVQVDNRSRTALTLSDIQLVAPDKSRSFASRLSDTDEQSEVLVLCEVSNGARRRVSLDVDANNLALRPRLDGNDSQQGYLVFYGLPVVCSGRVRHMLHLSASGKVYKTRIYVEALPDNLIPLSKAQFVPRR